MSELQAQVSRLSNNATMRKLVGGGFLLVPARLVDELPDAGEQYEGQLVWVRAVPGTSAAKLYACLGDDAAVTAYSWVEVAAG